MLDTVIDIVLDALLDTLKLLPFLFLAYLLMEFAENRSSDKLRRVMQGVGAGGPAIGSILGCVPQCGFSASASNLYTAGMISVGTLISVYLSTSDEALILLISEPSGRGSVLKLLLCKLVIGVVWGYIIDGALKLLRFKKADVDICENDNCGCDEETGILRPALRHTLRIALFILLINLVLGAVMELVGEEQFAQILSRYSGAWFSPFLAALIGLIPNCAASILLTKLYLSGALSFGAALAGLCSGAGIGIAVLVRTNTRKRENVMIILLLYFAAVITGLLWQTFAG